MIPPSPSSISLAAFILALITSPQDGTSFPLSRIPQPAAASTNRYPRASPLHSAVDMPMRPMEEEREKNKRNKDNGNSNSNSSEDQKGEWKQVVGGFVPKFLKRDNGANTLPTVQMVDNLEDYKRFVVDEDNQIVVVRFYAPWCKSCKAAHPHFKKMVSKHSPSGVKFVEVPLTKETAYIHEGLGVPSVPFGHIYHPDVGLVEEKKINRKVFGEFRDALDCYVSGSCDLPMDMEEEEEDETINDVGFQ